jgi:hypothetical protein
VGGGGATPPFGYNKKRTIDLFFGPCGPQAVSIISYQQQDQVLATNILKRQNQKLVKSLKVKLIQWLRPETKSKLSEANKGKNNPMFGGAKPPHSEQSKAKMGVANLVIPKSEEHKLKISLANPNRIKIEVNYLELGGGSASPLKLLIILKLQQLEP